MCGKRKAPKLVSSGAWEGAMVLGGFLDFAAFEALGADLDALGAAGCGDTNFLQIRLEKTGRDSGDVLADAAFFLGLAAPQDAVAADFAFVTNFTTS
jgi:hypothetical protein